MTAEEKAAVEWLRVAFAAEGTSRCHWFPDANDMKQAATLKAMLAHLTAPKTKTVWRVQPEGWPFEDFEAIYSATARASHWLAQDIEVSIRKIEVST